MRDGRSWEVLCANELNFGGGRYAKANMGAARRLRWQWPSGRSGGSGRSWMAGRSLSHPRPGCPEVACELPLLVRRGGSGSCSCRTVPLLAACATDTGPPGQRTLDTGH